MAHLVPFFMPALLTGPGLAWAAGEEVQLMRQSDTVPSPALHAHWQRGRAFSGYLSREQAFYREDNGGSTADDQAGTTHAGMTYERAVTPSVGSTLGLGYVLSSSDYDSSQQGVTAASERTITATTLTADHTFKIMDTIVLGLRLGYRAHRVAYQSGGGEDGGQNAYTVGPGIAWKHRAFEASVFHESVLFTRKNDDSDQVWRRHGSTTAALSAHDDGAYQWSLWYERNPQPSCCTSVSDGRQAYGAALFLHAAAVTWMPGYRYLSELSAKDGAVRTVDAARHQVFTGLVTSAAGGTSGLHLTFDLPAKDAPSSFIGSEHARSDVTASRWQLSGSWRLAL